MIRSGRCDECRRRKRKCDEVKPACMSCIERRVTCRYSKKVSKFVHILTPGQNDGDVFITTAAASRPDATPDQSSSMPSMQVWTVECLRSDNAHHSKSSVKPNQGRKRAHGSPCSPSLALPLKSAAMRLSEDLVSVTDTRTAPGLSIALLGDWIDLVPARIGSSDLLDSAVACVVCGHRARRSKDDIAGQTGRRKYGQCLKLLRDAVVQPATICADAVAASRLLMLYELLSSEANGYICHANGAVRITHAMGPACLTNDFERIMFYQTYAQAWQHGLQSGRPSVFDEARWLSTPSVDQNTMPNGPYNLVGVHDQTRMYVMTKMPRLVALVRAVYQNPKDMNIMARAVELAEHLLKIDWDTPETFEAPLVPTKQSIDRTAVPLSYAFDQKDYWTVIEYQYLWTSKIILCGLYRTLMGCGVHISWPGIDAIRAEEYRCAVSICMTADYKESLAPYGAVCIINPLQTAWGAFWRKSQADGTQETHTEALMEFVQRKSNAFVKHIKGAALGREELLAITRRLEGRPTESTLALGSAIGMDRE